MPNFPSNYLDKESWENCFVYYIGQLSFKDFLGALSLCALAVHLFRLPMGACNQTTSRFNFARESVQLQPSMLTGARPIPFMSKNRSTERIVVP